MMSLFEGSASPAALAAAAGMLEPKDARIVSARARSSANGVVDDVAVVECWCGVPIAAKLGMAGVDGNAEV